MTIFLASTIWCLSIIPFDAATTDDVHTLERNVVYGDDGQHTFDQFIFHNAEGQIISWRMKKAEPLISGNQMLFWDGPDLRRIRFQEFRTVHSGYDRELAGRTGICNRRELTTPTPRQPKGR